MPGEIHDSAPPRPSVFLSYASEDRAAARTLRDTLAAAGLDVWLDEEELAGGEAWDAKIRQQIRTCTYFMPVISATTETRREGYFRREWRFAIERTLDLADDVMFLVPVVIDDTRDNGARVPEKFFTVQWLRVPGGAITSELQKLAAKLATGETIAAHPPATAAPAGSQPTGRKPRREEKPVPPFPDFPAFPEPGHRLRFIYNLVLWIGRMLHVFWLHLPRFVRVIAAMVIIFKAIAWVFRDGPEGTATARNKPETTEAAKALWAVNQKGLNQDKSEAIESVVSAVAAALQLGRPVTLVTFSGDGEKSEAYAEEVFDEVGSLLKKDDQAQWGVSPLPLATDATDAEVLDRGRQMKSRFVLTGHAGTPIPGLPSAFTARLFDVGTGELVWKETFETATHESTAVAQRIAAEVTKHLEPPAPPAQPVKP